MKVANCYKLVLLVCFQALASPPTIPQSDGVYQFTEIESGIVEIQNTQTGDVIFKDISIRANNNPLRDIPEIVIDKDTIDFGFYEDYYTLWQEVHVWDRDNIMITDTDHDGRNEIIAERWWDRDLMPAGEMKFHNLILEENENGLYEDTHDYADSTLVPYWTGDLDGDDLADVLMRKYYVIEDVGWKNAIYYYESAAYDSLATLLQTSHSESLLSQINDVMVFDLDQDGLKELIYFRMNLHGYPVPCDDGTNILEYDPESGEFVEEDCFDQDSEYTSGYAIGDFDLDGNYEFATGGFHGETYIYESVGPDAYRLEFVDTVDTYNAYNATMTSDINGNGIPELWIMGCHNTQDNSYTVITCIEATAANTYSQILKITLPGLFLWYAEGIDPIDFDADGNMEFAISAGPLILVVDFDGVEPTAIFAHFNMESDDPPYPVYRSVTFRDFQGSPHPELLISIEESPGTWPNLNRYNPTYIYYPSESYTDIEDSPTIPIESKIVRAFPNPFNSWVKINISAPHDQVEMKIYSIRGQLIYSEQLQSNNSANEMTTYWNGKYASGKEANSGVYILSVSNDSYQESIKLMYLK